MLPLTDIILDFEGETLATEKKEKWLGKAEKRKLPNYQKTQVYGAQKLGNFGEGIKIGIIDSGVDYRHEQFENIKKQLKEGVNLSGEGDLNDPLDVYGHGTQIAGILCGKDTGIVPKAEFYIVKIFKDKESLIRSGEAGVVSGINLGLNYCEEAKCDIINLSLGSPGYKRSLEKICRRLSRKGVLLVAAVGKYYTGAFFPAAYSDYVISVGSVNTGRKHVESCNVWPKDIVTFGKKIFSTHKDNKYHLGDGSSYATAQVTGILALALSAMKKPKKPDNIQKVRQALRKTADKSVLDFKQAEKFIRKYDPQKKILKGPEEVVQFMFGEGLIRTKDLINELIK